MSRRSCPACRRLPFAPPRLLLALLTLLAGARATWAAITTEVSFNDPSAANGAFYAPLTSHVRAAVDNWTNQLSMDATVRVAIRFSGSSGTTADGRSFTNAFSHQDGARHVQMAGLAAKLTGLIPNGNTSPDVDIFVNPSYLANELWIDPEPARRHCRRSRKWR